MAPVLFFDPLENRYEIWLEKSSVNVPTPLLLLSDTLLNVEVLNDPNFPELIHYRIGSWKVNTSYRYHFVQTECASDTFEFRTFPSADFSNMRIGAASCVKITKPSQTFPLLDTLLKCRPDLMLWLGDNVYLTEKDWRSEEGIRDCFRRYRQHPQLRLLYASVPNIFIRDDHDFGPNDADSSFALKEVSNKLFKSYFRTIRQIRSVDSLGLFDIMEMGEMVFVLTDNRTFRSSLDVTNPQIFGDAQLNQIQRALLKNRGKQWFLLSGGQILNSAAKYENLSLYVEEYARVLRDLAQFGTSTFILSGDRHFGEVSRKGPIVEFTTSPLSASYFDPKEVNEYRIAGVVARHNFLLLTVAKKKIQAQYFTPLGATPPQILNRK